MSKSSFQKLAAVVLVFALLFNICTSVMFNASATETQLQVNDNVIAETDYIDNSALIPAYLPNDKVTLELSDDGEHYWTPDWVKDLIIVEANPSWSSDGTLNGMDAMLKHLSEAGINGLWLTPINEKYNSEGTKSAGNAYSNFGPHTIAASLTGTEYGDTEAALTVVKQFVDKAHSHNIRVFFDVVTWGVNYDSPLYTEKKSWFNGEKVEYSGYLFDWGNAKRTGLYSFVKDSIVNLMKTTGADGFRADCGANYSGKEIFRDIRETLINDGYKIAIFSENPSERDGTFDLDLHSYVDETYSLTNTNKIYLDNNIIDSSKDGTYAGSGRYYSSLISCHDYTEYSAQGNLIQMGYASILTPYIPVWYLGEEFNNRSPDVGQLFRNPFYWSEIDNNRQYFETIKSYIRTRRLYSDSFAYFDSDSTNNNIVEVSTDADSLLPAYARYGEGTAVLVVPNNSNTDVKLNVNIPVFDIDLDSSYTYQLKDTVTGKILISDFTCNDIGNAKFNVTIKSGEIGVYAIEKVASVYNGWLTYEASVSNSISNKYTELRCYIDKPFSINYKDVANASYWKKALHQPMKKEQDTNDTGYWTKHNALAEMLRENIYINGISIDEGISSSDIDCVKIVYRDDMNDNVISVYVRENDNPFGVSVGQEVNMQIKDGILLDGYALGDINLEWHYVNNTQKAVRYHKTNKIVAAEYTEGIITLTAEERLESFCERENIATLISNKISINGTTVSTDDITIDENLIKIAYNATSDFDIYISNGIILNAKEISPVRYNVSVETSATDMRILGDYIEISDTEGAFTPYYSYFNKVADDFTNINCGDTKHYEGSQYVLNFTIQNASEENSIKEVFSSSNNYQNSHLQVSKADNVNPYIIINGKSVADWLSENTDVSPYKALHIRAANDTVLQIIIPESNIFDFDITKPFAITFDEGLTLNGKTVNARTFNCPGHSFDAGTQYNKNYFSKVTKWSDGMVSEDNATISKSIVLSTANTSAVCSSHSDAMDATSSWLIQMQLDKTVYNSSCFETSYYRRHLHCTGSGDTRTNFSTAEVFRNNILINGKNLTELHELSTNRTDWTEFLHVEITDTNVLRILIPKDNTYGFDGDSDFSIQIKDGIVMNGININPFVYTHTAALPTSAVFTTPSTKVETAACEFGSYIKIRLYDNTNKPSLQLANLSNGALQNVQNAASDVFKELGVDLCKYIKINGETIAEANIRNKNYSSAMIHLNNDGRVLQIQIDTKNIFNITSSERFTISVLEGLNINGYVIEPTVCHYDTKSCVISDGYWSAVNKYTNGTVSPRSTVDGTWITYQQNNVSAGEKILVKVEPNAGYQLKAGSLTYNYWYKGTYIKEPINKLSKIQNGVAFYEFNSPDVVGIIDAEFVSVDETVNMYAVGAKCRTEGPQGIKFIYRLFTDNIDLENNKITISGVQYDIVEIGSQITIVSDSDNIVWDNAKVELFNGISNDKYVEFGPEIVNIEAENYGIEFASRAYLSYIDSNGETQTIYTDELIRSVDYLLS